VRKEARMEFRILDTVRLREEDPHGVTSQKTPFFIITAVKTSNLT
jgi:hypothetical protein